MKITKTPLKVSIEISPKELQEFRYNLTPEMTIGLLVWIKEEFRMDLLPKSKK